MLPADSRMDEASKQENQENVKAVRRLLHQMLRVELTDGRVMEGSLDCYDDSGNMILACTTDVTSKLDPSRARQKTYRMGTVLIPGHAQVNIKVFRRQPPVSGDIREALSNFRNLKTESNEDIVIEEE